MFTDFVETIKFVLENVITGFSVNAYSVFVPSLAHTIKFVITSAFATVSTRKLNNKKIDLFIIKK